ncbi:MAG: hypothetical protein WCS75_03055 [Sphingomonas sp.]|jgi:hypothetical protein|uniref:hypothetical protein n=1 Tax=Sphingomonas sp. TaxID=28214 RepID=UPI00356A8B0D
MRHWTTRFIVLATLAATTLLGGCHRPVSNLATLQTVETEARLLMATHPAESSRYYTQVPQNQWPAAIASLHPESVTVHTWGVDVLIKSYFDGGWGYHVAKQRRDLPMLGECYSAVSKGVFWHGPC